MDFASKHSRIAPIFLALILVLAALLVFSGFYGPTIANTDNFFYITYAHEALMHGLDILPYTNNLTTSYFLLLGMAALDAFFRNTIFSAVLFEYIMLSGTIITVYLIGRRLFGVLGGIISSFTCAISPLLIVLTKAAGDDVPMTFFASLSVLFYLMHTRGKHGSAYLMLSGFIIVAGMLVVYESMLMLPTILILIIAEHVHAKKGCRASAAARDIIVFATGALLGTLIIALVGYAVTGVASLPMNIFINYFSQLKQPLPYNPLVTYVEWLFGQYGLVGMYGPIMTYYLLSTTLLAVIFGFYLFRKAAVPAIWVVTTLLLLSAVTDSATIIPLERLTTIFTPATALLIGGGIAKFYTRYGHRTPKRKGLPVPVFMTLSALIVTAMVTYSFISIYTIARADSISAASYTEAMSAYNAAQNGSLYAYANAFDIFLVYSNFNTSLRLLLNLSCSGIMQAAAGAYAAVPNGSNNTCGLPVVYRPNITELTEKYGPLVGEAIADRTPIIVKVEK